MNAARLTAPEHISSTHGLEEFDCGEPSLNEWLAKRALANEAGSASRTYVVCDRNEVVGYYCLASGAIDRASAPKPMQRNMPNPIPVMIMGRLAVDHRYHGQGIGSALLRDAVLRVLQVAEIAGMKAILVHAISESARQFYLQRGFLASPVEPRTLCLVLETARQGLAK